jgi:hypothetical protein
MEGILGDIMLLKVEGMGDAELECLYLVVIIVT